MAVASLAEWQVFLQSRPEAHILQTGEWGELKGAFGWKPVRIISESLAAQVLFRNLPLGMTFAYLPKPVFSRKLSGEGSDEAGLASFLRELDAVCQSNRAIFLKVEPDLWEGPAGPWIAARWPLRPSPHQIQPRRTILVSLQGSDEDILARMKQKCRYNVHLAEKKGVAVRPWDDLEAFHRMVTITGGRDGFSVHSLAYYRRAYELFHPAGMAELLVAEFEGRALAALMVFARGKRAWYLYGASTDEERNRMPAYLLQWESMRWARAHGCAEYDLWGVPDEDPDSLEEQFESRSNGLWGVYRFKRGFGGRVVRAAQALDRVYNPLLYRLYLWRYAGSAE